MISIVVYGRNDNHGYNLHKRVALSLNCFAEVLTERNDEIIFVDYNTPDEHPSLPETIQDTLTPRAKKHLRVVRAFASVHRHFADKTPFPVVEAIARNIGFRRTNPANRWILSTNTDMILTPRDKGRSFSEIAAGLKDGFYLLPRFELPEAMWELLDRNDPAGVIDRVREWGQSLSLNEVINRPLVRYDAPGDFQLVLRRDLMAMSGMDERMLLGNMHVDSNLCRRAEALRGELRTLVDELFGYHCAHTRTATFVHSRGNVANDFERFVRNVTEWRLPEQANTWGAPAGHIEEIAIAPPGSATLYERAMRRTVKPLSAPFDEIEYGKTIQDGFRYRLDHMLPYLGSAIAPLPKNYSIGVATARTDVLTALAKLWREFGFTGAIGVRRSDAKRVSTSGWAGEATLKVVEDDDFASAFDCYLFEFGLASEADRKMSGHSMAARWAKTDSDALAAVTATLHAFMPIERERARTLPPRRCFFIGAANNQFEPLINDNFDVTFTPFTSRVRQGNVHVPQSRNAPAKFDPHAMAQAVQASQNRSRQPSSEEIVQTWSQLVDALRPEARVGEVTGAHAALLDVPGARALLGLDDDAFAKARARIQGLRRSHKLAAGLEVPVSAERAAGAPAISKFGDPQDWEDPAWFANVERFFGGSAAYATQNRHRDVWMAGQIIYDLQQFGLGAHSRGIVATAYPDDLYAALSQIAGGVHVYRSVLAAPAEQGQAVREAWLGTNVLPRAHALSVSDDALTAAPSGEADFVVLARNSAAQFAPVGFVDCLRAADAALRAGGVMVIALDVRVGGQDDVMHENAAALRTFCSELAQVSGLEPAGQTDWRLSPDALDRTVDEANVGRPHFVRHDGAMLIAPVVLAFRKTGETRDDVWRALRESQRNRPFVPLLRYLKTNEPHRVVGDAVRIHAGTAPGIAVFGPYFTLLSGGYRVTLNVEPQTGLADDTPVLGIEIVAGERHILFLRDINALEARAGAINVDFTIPPIEQVGYQRFQLRLYALGAGAVVRVGTLEAAPPVAQAPLKFDLVRRNHNGANAARTGRTVVVRAQAPHGHFLYGPYQQLPSGWWRLALDIEIVRAQSPDHGVVNLEMLYGGKFVPPLLKLTEQNTQGGPLILDFFVPPSASLDRGVNPEAFEFRLLFLGGGDVTVRAFTLEAIQRQESPNGWAFGLDRVIGGRNETALWLPPGEWRATVDSGAEDIAIVAGDGVMAGPEKFTRGAATLTLPRRAWDGSMRLVVNGAARNLMLQPAFDVLHPAPLMARALSPFDADPESTPNILFIAARAPGQPPREMSSERAGRTLIVSSPAELTRAAVFVMRRKFDAIRFDFAEANFDLRLQSPLPRMISAALWLFLIIAARLRARSVTVEAQNFDSAPKGFLTTLVRHTLFSFTHATTGSAETIAAISRRWPGLARKLRVAPKVRLYEGDAAEARAELGLGAGLNIVCIGSGEAGDATVVRAFALAGRPGVLTVVTRGDQASGPPADNHMRTATARTESEIDRWLTAADAIVLPHANTLARAAAERAHLHRTIVMHAADQDFGQQLRSANAVAFTSAADLACLLEGLAEDPASIDASQVA